MHRFLTNTTDITFHVIPIKDLIYQDNDPTTLHKLETGEKKVSKVLVLFCPGVVQRATEHIGTKALNMPHWSQKGFWVSSF